MRAGDWPQSMFVVDQPPKGWGMGGFRTFCDPLYDRDDAISLWNGEIYLEATPQVFSSSAAIRVACKF